MTVLIVAFVVIYVSAGIVIEDNPPRLRNAGWWMLTVVFWFPALVLLLVSEIFEKCFDAIERFFDNVDDALGFTEDKENP